MEQSTQSRWRKRQSLINKAIDSILDLIEDENTPSDRYRETLSKLNTDSGKCIDILNK